MTVDPYHLYEWLSKFGFPAAMALFIWALLFEKVYLASEVNRMRLDIERERKEHIEELAQMKAERDEFKRMVITAQNIAATSLTTTQKVQEKVKE